MIKDERIFVNPKHGQGLIRNIRNRRCGKESTQTGLQKITEFIGQPAGKVLTLGPSLINPVEKVRHRITGSAAEVRRGLAEEKGAVIFLAQPGAF